MHSRVKTRLQRQRKRDDTDHSRKGAKNANTSHFNQAAASVFPLFWYGSSTCDHPGPLRQTNANNSHFNQAAASVFPLFWYGSSTCDHPGPLRRASDAAAPASPAPAARVLPLPVVLASPASPVPPRVNGIKNEIRKKKEKNKQTK
jgi:hypothetical protein